jgi:hypothetical protein
MITPNTLLAFGATGLLLYMLTKGTIKEEKKSREVEKEEEKKKEKKEAEKELNEQVSDIIKLNDPKTGKFIRVVNLDTIAENLNEALNGQWWNEDEERVIKEIQLLPKVIADKNKKYWYPIQKVALRYAQKTKGKNLKKDLVRLLSARELTPINGYLIYI